MIKCDYCDRDGKLSDLVNWFQVRHGQSSWRFCERVCLIKKLAPEINKAIVLNQWIPTEEEIERMHQ